MNQIWATAGYLMTPQTVHFQSLWDNMKASVISQAKSVETSNMDKRPSRRSTNENDGYFRTIQNVHHTLVAHAVTTNATDKALFRKALALEADWGLGRNPANLIEMGTSTTPLAAKRGVKYMYTAGVDDGVPGTTPGQTPYCNLDDWDTSMTMGSPSKLYQDSYPADFKNTWPIGEGCFETPWVWAHSEYTPQQTMRGKTALYGYLYGLGKSSSPSGTGGASGSGGAAGRGGGSGGGGAIGNGGTTGSGGTVTGSGGAPGSGGGAPGCGGRTTGGGGVMSTGGSTAGSGGAPAGGNGGTLAGSGGQGGSGGGSSALGGNAGSTGTQASSTSGCGCHIGSPSKQDGAGAILAFLAIAFAAVSRRRLVPRQDRTH
jgi:hypothetical protein